ncbi:MAG: CTP synthase [Alphaproteobacteria bacterium 41-28]|nr:MAG: CTP synthase [Alphaproteobacteria bacterium 41-28]
MARFIFVTGGVVSSLGKGIASASLGALLQARGYKVLLRKLEPYINVDPGTMNPFQHGEVFVTEDGAETDLDLGHYERFTGVNTTCFDAISTGRIYSDVIANERRGDYLGATVQVIPHVTDAIKGAILKNTGEVDFAICEIGGTVGDIEGLPFLEAIRQLRNDLGYRNSLYVHLTLVPYIPTAGELKTKPTQHSVQELQSKGIQPDILLCRSDRPIGVEERRKLALFCNVKPECVIEALDVATIYQVPISYHEQGLDSEVCKHFGLEAKTAPDLAIWERIVETVTRPEGDVTIGVVGKYTGLLDAYKSLHQALIHGGIANKVNVNIEWIDADQLENGSKVALMERLSPLHGILVPGGFGERGSRGKIAAIQYAREHKIPYFGVCFGLQMAVLEALRNMGGFADANSSEFGSTSMPAIALMTEWIKGDIVQKYFPGEDLGGTMRLGTYECHLTPGSKAYEIYKSSVISERHRHRYEVNTTYLKELEKCGLYVVGTTADGLLPEIAERKDHPWFVAVQFHPEFKSRPFKPHPLFTSFIEAAINQNRLI